MSTSLKQHIDNSKPTLINNILTIIGCPLLFIVGVIRLIIRIPYQLLLLIFYLIKTFFFYIFPKNSKQQQPKGQKTQIKQPQMSYLQRFNIEVFNFFNKYNYKYFQSIIINPIKSLKTTIPQTLSQLFPKRVFYEKTDKKDIETSKLRQTSNQVLIEIKIKEEKQKKQNQKQQNKQQQKILKTQSQLLKKQVKKATIIYYVPTYLRFKLKNFTAIDLDKLQAQANVDIIIDFVYGNKDMISIPQQIVSRLFNQVVLNFQRDDPLKLQQDSVHISTKQNQKEFRISFTVRKKIHMRIQSQIYLTPFQKLYLILPITIQQLTPKDAKVKQSGSQQDIQCQAIIKFNYMDNKAPFVKADFANQKNFGYYSLIQTGLGALYSNQRVTSIQQQKEQLQKQKKLLEQQQNKSKQNKTQKPKIQNKQLSNSFQTPTKSQAIKIQSNDQQRQELLNHRSPNKANAHKKGKKNKKNNKSNQNQQKESNQNNKIIQIVKQFIKSQQPKVQEKNTQQKNDKDKSKDQKKKDQIKNFQYSFFKIPIYKHPMASLVMIFLPLWSLAIINLGIFFQQNNLGQRIASIASLMIAFIALNETIRSQIPPHPKVVFVEILVYAQMLACFVCLLNSFLNEFYSALSQDQHQQQKIHFKWNQNKLFITALSIFILQIIIIVVMTLHHYYIKVPSYLLHQKKPKIDSFNSKVWSNKVCDIHFKKIIQQTKKLYNMYEGLTQYKKLKQIQQQKGGQTDKSQKVIFISSDQNIGKFILKADINHQQQQLQLRSTFSIQQYRQSASNQKSVARSQSMVQTNPLQ